MKHVCIKDLVMSPVIQCGTSQLHRAEFAHTESIPFGKNNVVEVSKENPCIEWYLDDMTIKLYFNDIKFFQSLVKIIYTVMLLEAHLDICIFATSLHI